MTRTPRDVPEAELAVLEALWRESPATRRQLAERIYPGAGPSQYATVQKLLERLEAKDFVRRADEGGVLHFSPVLTRDDLIAKRLEDVVDRLCGGSLTPVLLNLVRERPLSADQLDELRKFLSDHRPAEEKKP